jgi:lipoate-protein ligase A
MQMLRVLQVYDDAEPRSAAMNMALDEALFESASAPLIRFYGWQQPSLSFGYFGRYADAADEAGKRDIVRRWTGGGIVMHGSDLTYSLILPAYGAEKLPPSREIYTQVHDAIRRALASRARATLATVDAPKLSEACFANLVVADVLVDGRKIAGAAQRRTRAGLLHQGTIQYENLPTSFGHAFAHELCSSAESKTFSAGLLARATQLAEGKYGTAGWLYQR